MSVLALAPSEPSSMLKDMLDKPLVYGEPVEKDSWSSSIVLREVVPGPRSPPIRKQALVNGEINGRQGPIDTSQHNLDGDMSEEADKQAGPSVLQPRSRSPTPPASTSSFIGPQIPSHIGTQANGSTATPAVLRKIAPPPSANDTSPTSSKTHVSPAGKSLWTDPINLSWPAPLISRNHGAAGLFNPSMTCYANATLQVILHTPPVLRIALAHDTQNCLQFAKARFCMLCDLSRMAREHWGKQKAYRPSEVHGHLGFIKKGFNKSKQEDTHEFFRFVTDALQNTELAGRPKNLPASIKHTTWVYQTWGGEVRSRVVCGRCKKPSDTVDHFLDLSLDVPQGGKKNSVETMLQSFVREDRLEGDNKYNCENCKMKANATKSFKIAQAPPILTLHLKRFSVNFNGYDGRARTHKYTQFIEYPEYLDIAPYMVDPSSHGTRYRLFGVTCHLGVEPRFGHYVSYVKSPSGSWYHADDEDMAPAKLGEVLSDKSAYVLSYIRIGANDTTPARTPLHTTSSPVVVADRNGHDHGPGYNASSPMAAVAASSPPSKRKRHWDGDDSATPRKMARATSPTSTPRNLKETVLNGSPYKPPTPAYQPEENGDSPRQWTYQPKGNTNGHGPRPTSPSSSRILAPRPGNPEHLAKSPIARTAHPSPGRYQNGGEKHNKRKGMPMPFAQGKYTGPTKAKVGWQAREPGVASRMQGKSGGGPGRKFKG